jgi:FixJ family two-component response regulator
MGRTGKAKCRSSDRGGRALIRMGAVYLVEGAGFKVYEAGSADAAIALLELHKEICLIFTDVDMPGSMDGLNSPTMYADDGPR